MRTPPLLLTLPLLLPLAACEETEPTRGTTTACLAGDLPENLYEYDGENMLFEVEGTVLSDEAGEMPETDAECYWTQHRVLQIEDAEGVVWSVGYGIEEPNGDDVTPALDLAAGDSVSLSYRMVQSFGSAHGFVIEDADGLVAALESGTWGPALEDGDVPGLTVQDGDLLDTLEVECGTEGHFQWTFEGDTTTTVAPYGLGAMDIDGVDYTAMAVANMQWQGDVQCTDLAGDQMWAVFR
jgi:hypothetical protein